MSNNSCVILKDQEMGKLGVHLTATSGSRRPAADWLCRPPVHVHLLVLSSSWLFWPSWSASASHIPVPFTHSSGLVESRRDRPQYFNGSALEPGFRPLFLTIRKVKWTKLSDYPVILISPSRVPVRLSVPFLGFFILDPKYHSWYVVFPLDVRDFLSSSLGTYEVRL